MTLHPINQAILKDIESFQTLTEVESYINSEKFKNLAIELQIDKIKTTYDKKSQKRYIKQIEDNILFIHQNLNFFIDNFKLENKSNIHFSSDVFSEKEKQTFQHTYCGKITITLIEPLTHTDISPYSLFQNTIFSIGNGGGGNISQYEFKFLENHLPNLSHQFLFDFKKDNSLLKYRSLPTNVSMLDATSIHLLSNHLTVSPNKIDNNKAFLNVLENIFEQHFHDHDTDIFAVNIITNVINAYSQVIKFVDSTINDKYIKYLKRAISFIQDEQNLEKIIQYNLPKPINEAMKHDNIKKIKENIQNTNKFCQLAIMKSSSLIEKIEIYQNILNTNISSKLSNNLISRSDAIKDKEFLNYCFDSKDSIPKFFTIGNILQNINYYISTDFNLSHKQKKKNEQIILDILKKQPSDKTTQSAILGFFYSPANSLNPFGLENKELINFFINQHILTKSNQSLDKIESNNFLKLCNYINSLDDYQFKINDIDISIQLLFVLTHQKKYFQELIKNNNYLNGLQKNSIEILDKLFEKTNQFIFNQSLDNQTYSKQKIKI